MIKTGIIFYKHEKKMIQLSTEESERVDNPF